MPVRSRRVARSRAGARAVLGGQPGGGAGAVGHRPRRADRAGARLDVGGLAPLRPLSLGIGPGAARVGRCARQKAPLRWDVMPTYLADIVAAHRARAEVDDRPLGDLVELADRTTPPRDFSGALRGGGLACIAEIKRRSPSKGQLCPDLQADVVAKEYVAGGAACLSVLTDGEFFGGSPNDLAAARHASGLPVLRKDFTVHEADVADARLMGADAVLLIVAALDDAFCVRAPRWPTILDWPRWSRCTTNAALDRALSAGGRIVGVNQRDLHTFEVDHDRACAMAARIPSEIIAVAESGIRGAEDARRLADAGYDAVLVGETLVRSGDRPALLRELVGHHVGAR